MSPGLQLKKKKLKIINEKTNEKEKGTGLGGGHQILLQETSYKLISIGHLQPENHRQRIKSNYSGKVKQYFNSRFFFFFLTRS